MKNLGISHNWIEIDRTETSISFKEVRDDAYIIHTIPINLFMHIKNQCDGCQRGMTLIEGIHINEKDSYDIIGCTKNRYKNECENCQKLEPGKIVKVKMVGELQVCVICKSPFPNLQ